MTNLGKYLAALFIALAVITTPAYAVKIDINKATVSELQQLNGIGEKKAKAIVAYRKKHGKFKTTDDLLKVPGVGEATVSKNLSAIGLPKGKTKLSAVKSSSKKKASSAKDKASKAKSKAKDKKASLKDKAKKLKKEKKKK